MSALDGQVALITGAGSETGQAAALALAHAGSAVCLCGAQSEWIEPMAAQIRAGGGRALAVKADVCEEAGAKLAVSATLNIFERIDLLVLISAVWGGGLIHEHRLDTWERVLAANLRGPFLMAREVLPGMRARRSGHIITLSSESALGSYERDGAYGVSMHALNALSAAIQVENEALGIRVDTLCTGLVLSPGAPDALQAGDVAEWIVWLATRPQGLKTNGPILIQKRPV